MKVFFDANILFSAAKPKSRIRALIDLLSRHGECVTNAYAIEEARRNLALKEPAHRTDRPPAAVSTRLRDVLHRARNPSAARRTWLRMTNWEAQLIQPRQTSWITPFEGLTRRPKTLHDT